jgi:hypothetical protein
MIIDQTDEFNDAFNRFGWESPVIDPKLGDFYKRLENE